MKSIIFAVGFVGAGLIGAVAGQALFPQAAPAPRNPGDTRRIEARIDDIADEVSRVSEEVRLLRAAAPLRGSPAAAGGVPFPEPVAGAAPLIGVASTSDPASRPSDPSLSDVPEDMIESKVRETVAEIAMEQRLEKARWAEAQQVKKEEAWLESIRAEVGLNDFQVDELLKLMKERRAFIAANKRKYAAIGPEISRPQREALEQEAADYGRQLDLELRKVMDASQYEAVMNKARGTNQQRGQGR